MRKLTIICAVVILVIMTVNVEAASKLYGTTGTGITVGDSTLIELDPTTGSLVSTIGPVGYRVNGLAYDPTSGKLYGGTSLQDPSYNGLIEIDMTTGAGTPVGVHGWGLAGGATAVTNITINSAGDMFGWWDPEQDDLVSIDKSTGIATLVGDSGIYTSTYGLAFDNSDTLYLVNPYGDTYTVDTTTGVASNLGNVTGIQYAHHGDFDPETNLYYGISPTWNPRSIHIIDISALSVTSTLTTVDDLHTLAFVPEITEINVVALDIKPNSCPNPLNVNAGGKLPVAIVGTEDFDVTRIDPSTVKLMLVAPVLFYYQDVCTPYYPLSGKDSQYDCSEEGPDGFMDMMLNFENRDIAAALELAGGPLIDGEEILVTLTGNLLPEYGGTPIVGEDVIRIIKKGK